MKNNISLLIKEAKPLYFARKRRKKRIAGIVSLCACFCCLLPFVSYNNNYEYLYDFDGLSEQLNQLQTGSIIQELGLPTDDYGFLRIS